MQIEARAFRAKLSTQPNPFAFKYGLEPSLPNPNSISFVIIFLVTECSVACAKYVRS